MTLLPISQPRIALTSGQVHAAAMAVLQNTFSDFEINGYPYTHNAVWDVLLYASANRVSVKSACASLESAPSYNWVYTVLKEGLREVDDLESLEQHTTDMWHTTFPKRLTQRAQKVAIDLVLIPYYGHAVTPGIRHSQATRSTTKFFCSASASLIKKNKRVTRCCMFVRPEDTLWDVLTRVLQRVQALGIRVKRVYLDREFAQVDVLRFVPSPPVVSVVALPKKGHTRKGLQRGKQSFRISSIMTSRQYGQITFPFWIACRYRTGRAKKRGVQYLLFAVLGECVSPVLQVAQAYRHRFGIESSYRIMHQARAKTTFSTPELRLLLVAIAFRLANLWVWCTWQMQRITRRRAHREVTLTLHIFCHFVAHQIEHISGIVTRSEL